VEGKDRGISTVKLLFQHMPRDSEEFLGKYHSEVKLLLLNAIGYRGIKRPDIFRSLALRLTCFKTYICRKTDSPDRVGVFQSSSCAVKRGCYIASHDSYICIFHTAHLRRHAFVFARTIIYRNC
jgi:hypothetical protein